MSSQVGHGTDMPAVWCLTIERLASDCTANALKLSTLGAGEAVARLMAANFIDAGVQTSACDAVRALAGSGRMARERLRSAGARKLLQAVMATHATHNGVYCKAKHALTALQIHVILCKCEEGLFIRETSSLAPVQIGPAERVE